MDGPRRLLVLPARDDKTGLPTRRPPLERTGGLTTRAISVDALVAAAVWPWLAARIAMVPIEPAPLVMEAKMWHGIKETCGTPGDRACRPP